MLFREERFVKPMDLPPLKFRRAFRVFAMFLKGDLRTLLALIGKGLVLVAILLRSFHFLNSEFRE
jgi:hypothetical protein